MVAFKSFFVRFVLLGTVGLGIVGSSAVSAKEKSANVKVTEAKPGAKKDEKSETKQSKVDDKNESKDSAKGKEKLGTSKVESEQKKGAGPKVIVAKNSSDSANKENPANIKVSEAKPGTKKDEKSETKQSKVDDKNKSKNSAKSKGKLEILKARVKGDEVGSGKMKNDDSGNEVVKSVETSGGSGSHVIDSAKMTVNQSVSSKSDSVDVISSDVAKVESSNVAECEVDGLAVAECVTSTIKNIVLMIFSPTFVGCYAFKNFFHKN